MGKKVHLQMHPSLLPHRPHFNMEAACAAKVEDLLGEGQAGWAAGAGMRFPIQFLLRHLTQDPAVCDSQLEPETPIVQIEKSFFPFR